MAMFDLAAALSEAAGRDLGIDNGREKIEYISIQDIHDDPSNFYSTEGIDELAANIEMIGLQQPIRVRALQNRYGSFYRVVSGHRRLAAWRKLDLDCPEETYRKIAAIIEPDREEPEALQQLRLIFANCDTRKMTGHDLQRQAERVKELLTELKESGYEFKGRMRDQVAQICGVSKSKLSRLDAIKNNLHTGIFNAYYAPGKINETTAYAISQLPEEEQSNICRKLSKGWNPTAEEVVRYEEGRKADEKTKELTRRIAEIQKTAPKEEEPQEADEDPDDEVYMAATPSWQTGIPSKNHGLFYCKIEIEDTVLRQILSFGNDPVNGPRWQMTHGYPLDDKCKIIGWWPLPED